MSGTRYALLLAYLFLALGLSQSLEPLMAVAEPVDLRTPQAWLTSTELRASMDDGALVLDGGSGRAGAAARRLQVADAVDFLTLTACFAANSATADVAMLVASARGALLDLNRHYGMRNLDQPDAAGCARDTFSRLPGDGDLFVQLRSETPGATVRLQRLELRAFTEKSWWRPLRVGMLTLGLGVIAVFFWPSGAVRSRLLQAAALLGVVAIVFGCCVGVGLKAQIYALFTGGVGSETPADLQALLEVAAPEHGFGMFTLLHAVLFLGTTLCVALVRRDFLLAMTLLAVTTETLQIYVPGRGPGISDVAVDLFGVGTAALLLVLLGGPQRVRLLLKQ